jgi:hypothetical protein
MKKTSLIKVIAAIFSISLLMCCSKVEDLVDLKTDQEKLYESLKSGVWNADSIRTTQKDAINKVVLSDSNHSGAKITFAGDYEYGAKGVMTIKYNKKGIDTTVAVSFRADENYMRLYYPSYSAGAPDIEIIYDVIENSPNKFAFERNENLVSPTNGATYGYARSLYRLSK